jgi:hypothetical protein
MARSISPSATRGAQRRFRQFRTLGAMADLWLMTPLYLIINIEFIEITLLSTSSCALTCPT